MKARWRALAVPACHAAHLSAFTDERGGFLKLFNDGAFAKILPGMVVREAYLTTSAKGVLRGMHFQLPPHDHAKIVICLSGAALDVMVDLRGGCGFGRTASVELTPEGTNCVAIPKGVGHGFYTREADTRLLYLVETGHAPQSDAGVMWDSIGFDWPDRTPLLSDRDRNHPALADFTVPAEWFNDHD